MLYIPGKLLFIHVPRTGGNAIKRQLTSKVVWDYNFNVCLANSTSLHRHSTASELQNVIPDFTEIDKFAIDRPLSEIAESDYRLHRTQNLDAPMHSDWKASVELSLTETLEEFTERRWRVWMKGQTPWEYWSLGPEGKDLGVQKYSYNQLDHFWTDILELLGYGPSVLPKIDWQKNHT